MYSSYSMAPMYTVVGDNFINLRVSEMLYCCHCKTWSQLSPWWLAIIKAILSHKGSLHLRKSQRVSERVCMYVCVCMCVCVCALCDQ